ncbi:MAG: hypothetical protein SPK35_00505, partial [Prevotella sp.]|nr:hypothetical protein [Prevotella sp.]
AGDGRPERAKAYITAGYITLLRLQRALTISPTPRVPLRSTLGYVLLRLQRVLVNVFSASM